MRNANNGRTVVCIIDGCGRDIHVGQYCATHYYRIRAGRPLLDPIRVRRRYTDDDKCSAPSCRRRASVGGYCKPHYLRHFRGKPMEAPIREPSLKYDKGTLCTSPGCERKVEAKGLCKTHRARQLVGRPTDRPIKGLKPRSGVCSHTGCGRPICARGLCATHYQNDKDGKPPLPVRKRVNYTIDDMHRVAEERGGQCLSTTYVNPSTKYSWRCGNAHEWDASWQNVNSGKRWCPECSSGRGERICRRIMELMFDAKFPKSYPEWLRDAQKRTRLELDGYNKRLGIAFEYQGDQHYEAGGRFSEDTVSATRRRDAIKRKKCWDNKTPLVVVPQFQRKRGELRDIIAQVEFAVIAAGLIIPKKWNTNKPTELAMVWSPAAIPVPTEIHELATRLGGKCLSPFYLADPKRMKWECARGHLWEAKWARIKRGMWCPQCVHDGLRNTLSSARSLAEMRGGTCLDDTYKNAHSRMTWRCARGHVWTTTYNSIQRGSWCRECHHLNRKQKNQDTGGSDQPQTPNTTTLATT